MAKKTEKQPASSNIFTRDMVHQAIKKLMKNTGWTSRTIIKFIKAEYRIFDDKLSRKVARALKRGVKLGLLVMGNGRYRLHDISSYAHPRSVRDLRKRNIAKTNGITIN